MRPYTLMNERMNRVLDEIKEERLRQDGKWGEQNHSPVEWMGILAEEVGEAAREAIEDHFVLKDGAKGRFREEMIQVAAVAAAIVECMDRSSYPDTDDDREVHFLKEMGIDWPSLRLAAGEGLSSDAIVLVHLIHGRVKAWHKRRRSDIRP